MSERRAFKRLPAEAEITLRPLDQSGTTKAHGRDLSGGGILFMSNESLAEGSLVDIEVLHPGELQLPPLRAVIRIVRVDGELPPYEVAGEFVEVR